ncbi:hypothetical protein [Actinoplanes awajinensis]|uniref:hypothetical protein n=1 Tax=Actinoplanes awajinensis TaxID=135946 RepID=UPI000AD82683|nr:hypothetical protein [Actinoplanes awajinensis]
MRDRTGELNALRHLHKRPAASGAGLRHADRDVAVGEEPRVAATAGGPDRDRPAV